MITLLNDSQEIPYSLLLLADDTIEAIDKYIHDSEIYTYEIENEIIGIYAIQEISEKEVEIKNVAVLEDYQGRGIGTSMIKDAIRRSKENKFKTISIGTGDASIRPLYLYQKLGFEMDHIKKGFFLDNYPAPIYENGIQLKHMVMLKMDL